MSKKVINAITRLTLNFLLIFSFYMIMITGNVMVDIPILISSKAYKILTWSYVFRFILYNRYETYTLPIMALCFTYQEILGNTLHLGTWDSISWDIIFISIFTICLVVSPVQFRINKLSIIGNLSYYSLWIIYFTTGLVDDIIGNFVYLFLIYSFVYATNNGMYSNIKQKFTKPMSLFYRTSNKSTFSHNNSEK